MPVISTGDVIGTIPAEIDGQSLTADLVVKSWKMVNGQVELTLTVQVVVDAAEGQVS